MNYGAGSIGEFPIGASTVSASGNHQSVSMAGGAIAGGSATVKFGRAVAMSGGAVAGGSLGAGAFEFTDNFNRADENPLASPWAQMDSFSRLRLGSNQVYGVTNNADNNSYLTTKGDLEELEVEIQAAVVNTGGDAGVYAHLNVTTGNGYYLDLYNNTLELFTMQTWGSYNSLGSAGHTAANGDVIKLRITKITGGYNLKGYVNGGTALIDVNDTTYAFAAGYVGAYIYEDGTRKIDNFHVLELNAPAGLKFGRVQVGLGGAIAGGSASLKAGRIEAMQGGAIAGGTAPVTWIPGGNNMVVSMQGGAIAGGSAELKAGKVFAGTGGAIAGGAGGVKFGKILGPVARADNFNRTDESPIKDPWVQIGQAPATGTLDIIGNQIWCSSGGTYGVGFAGPDTVGYGIDFALRITVKANSAGGMALLYDGTDFLFVDAEYGGDTKWDIYIAKYGNSGWIADLATYNDVQTGGDIRLTTVVRQISTTSRYIDVYAGNTLVGSYQDTRTISGSTRNGLAVWEAFGFLDDYEFSTREGGLAGGSAQIKRGRQQPMAGGAIVGGSASVRETRNLSLQMQGGAVAGGTAGFQQAQSRNMLGGAVAGGAAGVQWLPQGNHMQVTMQGGAVAGGEASLKAGRKEAGSGGAVAGGAAGVTWAPVITGTAETKGPAGAEYAYQLKLGGSTERLQLEIWPDYHPPIKPIEGSADSRAPHAQTRAHGYYRPELDLTIQLNLEATDIDRAVKRRTGNAGTKPGHPYTIARGLVTNDDEDLLQAIATATIEEEINA